MSTPSVLEVPFSSIQHFAAPAAKEHVTIKESKKIRWFVVVSEDGTVGCAGLFQVRPGVVRIKGIFIDPAYRCKGLGSVLTEHVISVAVTDKCSRIEANVYKSEWYEARGFVREAPQCLNGAIKIGKSLLPASAS